MSVGFLEIDPFLGSRFGNLFFGRGFVDRFDFGYGYDRQEFGKQEKQREKEAQRANVHTDFDPAWGIH